MAVYRRIIEASLERIWENVLDWEHLPWLHRSSFLEVDLLAAERDGWHARVVLPPRDTPSEAEFDVRLDRPRLRYLTRTVAGTGAGTEILTTLDPLAARSTAITVTFSVPGVEPARARAVGDAYVRAYARLWDEDEAMMRRRQALLDAPGGRPGASLSRDADRVRLGPIDQLRARLPLLIEVGGRALRLVEIDGEILAHPTVCPHSGGPLDAVDVEDGCIRCPWHGYRFVVRTGENADGHPCRLAPALLIGIDASTGEAMLQPR